ncbi:Tubulin delta chain [Symbiodinium microadriaticum]|uniref:Tubulin delta chain n=1 Tax=Symbiodinium microadriaticum TaxID=2951 RepID=A0A1Q9DHT3_SYMMI|nr:Tubulin delta chain [Symbiodinium microadriaticum]
MHQALSLSGLWYRYDGPRVQETISENWNLADGQNLRHEIAGAYSTHVASWCGLPTHPVLPFLTKQLRPGFRRVHILVPPDCVTFETYIVAAEFDPAGHNSRPDPVPLRPRESRNSLLGLEPAEMCKFNFLNWLRSPLRSWSTGYDDVLAWTLNFRREIYEECLPKYKDTVVNDVRADAAYDRPWLTNMPAKSHVARSAPLDMEARFDEMWSIYATKLGLLMNKLEPHSLDPELMPEKPPYRFNATTSWSVPRPILPPAELVILPQRKQMTTEGVPEERSESKVEVSTLGSKSTPSKSRSRSKGGSKEHSKRGRTKSKESGKIKSGACETLPNDSSTSSEKPTAGISASEISGSSSATAPTSAIPIVLEQEGVSEEPPVAQTADGKLEPPGDAAPDPGSGNDGLTAPANPQDPEIDLFEELPQLFGSNVHLPCGDIALGCTIYGVMAPPTDTDGGCPEPFDTILFVDVDGVLNVGIQDDGNAPILLKTNELDLARELCAAGYNGRDADTARRICALASHAADCFGSITYEALASQDQLSKVLLGRLALLIQEAGNRCHVVLSSSWRKKQHAGRRKVLEEELSQCLGRPFVFDGVTALLLPERHAVHRLAAIRMYLSDFAQKDRFTANVKVVVIDDFFLSPVSGWDCGDTSCQIGDALWPALAQERPGSPEFFRTRSAVCPRAILVDAEPKVVESVLCQDNGAYKFDPASAVTTQSGRGGNFALGYAGDSLGRASSLALDGDSEPLWAKAMERFRQQVEGCHGRHLGTYLAHSLGGGTGSGLGTRLAEEVRDAYPKASLLTTSILPISSGENPMQSYNAILALSCMQEVSDGIVLYENDMLLASADDSKTADYSSGTSLASMNSVLVRDLVPHLCPDSQPADLGEVLSAAVPLPSHKIVQAFSGEVLSSLGPPSSPKPVIDALRHVRCGDAHKSKCLIDLEHYPIARIESVTDAEAYLVRGMESSDLTAEVKILHCYEELATGGYRLQVSTGLSGSLLADAFEFLKPKDAVSPVHLEGGQKAKLVKEGAKKTSFFQVVANAFAMTLTRAANQFVRVRPVKRHIARPQVAGRAQCTMWMSSTLGAAPGIGPDPVALTNSSSWLSAALEKIPTFYAHEALPTLYRRPWPKALQRSPYEQVLSSTSADASRPRSATSGVATAKRLAGAVPSRNRPSSTSGRRGAKVSPKRQTAESKSKDPARPHSAASRLGRAATLPSVTQRPASRQNSPFAMGLYLDNHLVVCGSAKVLLSAAVASAYATFPLKSQAMGLSHTQRAEVLSAYPLLYLAMLFPAGAVCDRIEGARLAMALGLAGLAISVCGFGYSTSLVMLGMMRSAQGLASSAADVSSAALVAAVAGTRLGYMEGVLESCEALGWILGPPIGAFLYDSVGFAAANCIWGLLAAGLVAPVLHLATPGVCKLLEEEPESADNGEVQTDADLVSYARLLIRLSAQGSPIFAYGACSGAMYSGLALHNRAIGTQRSALLQLLVAVSYLVAAPVVGRQCDECAGDWAALSKKLAMGWAILFVGFGLLATDAGIPSMALGLLLLGLGEAFVLLPSYPRLTLECPHRPGLVSAVFNGMWALGQASGPFILALVSWSQAEITASCLALMLAGLFAALWLVQK